MRERVREREAVGVLTLTDGARHCVLVMLGVLL